MTCNKYYEMCLQFISTDTSFGNITYTLSLDDNYMPIETSFDTDSEHCIVGSCIDDVLHDAYTMFSDR